MRLGDHDGIGFVTWTQGDLLLLLAGELPEERLGAIARAVENDFKSREGVTGDTGAPAATTTPAGIVGEGADAAEPVNKAGSSDAPAIR